MHRKAKARQRIVDQDRILADVRLPVPVVDLDAAGFRVDQEEYRRTGSEIHAHLFIDVWTPIVR